MKVQRVLARTVVFSVVLSAKAIAYSDLRRYACTANAGSDAIEEFEAAGFAGVLTKPLDLQSLEKFLARL
jgi:CheY-like chemotaxis protein